jgi:hypothetical protein
LFADRGDGIHNGNAIDGVYARKGGKDLFEGERWKKVQVASPFTMDELRRLLSGLMEA